MDCKIFLIVDGHPAQKAKRIRSFAEENADAIGVFFLSPYAPELNPGELASAHLKARLAKETAKKGRTQTND